MRTAKRILLLIFLAIPGYAGKTTLLDIPGINRGNLSLHVYRLASGDSARAYFNKSAQAKAIAYIESCLVSYADSVIEQRYPAEDDTFINVITRIGQGPGKKVVIGAHYDVCMNLPGADDNASGVAGLLEIARILSERRSKLDRTYELAFYAAEEPPFFNTKYMGSYVHAMSLKNAEEEIDLMITLEMIGYFVKGKNSQHYPLGILKLFNRREGDFIAVISDFRSGRMAKRLSAAITRHAAIPCSHAVLPKFIPGISFSDHANFWGFKYRALMITDTALYRNRNYHTPMDTPETLDYAAMAEVVKGVTAFLLYGM